MRGFVISWFYPPINSSEALVTFKLLNQSAIKHDVFTQNDNSLWSYNTSESKLTNSSIKTIFGNGESLEAWIKSCVEYFDEHHNEYDFIMSRSMPPESHEAVLAIKKKYPRIPWIASFGDPIYHSPYTSLAREIHEYPPLPLGSPIHKKAIHRMKRDLKQAIWHYRDRIYRQTEAKNNAIENAILNAANVIIFNNSYQKEFMLKGHKLNSDTRHVVLPHPFEKSFYPQSLTETNSEKVRFTHIGHLDRIRSPRNLLRAVARLKDKKPKLYRKLIIDFYGTFDDESKILIVDKDLFHAVRVHKPVTYFESLELMHQYDWCLLIDANISTQTPKNIYLAAKVSDYLGSGTPIFGITMTDGASADILKETGNLTSSHSVDEIYMNLVMILEERISSNIVDKEVNKYDAKSTAKVYDSIVEKLVK